MSTNHRLARAASWMACAILAMPLLAQEPPPAPDTAAAPAEEAPPADASVTDAPSGAKSYVAQDKENQKKREEAQKKAAKAGDPAKKAQEAEQRCAQAKSAHQYYVDGGRILKHNDKGEREFMSDAEIDAARERTRREMEAAFARPNTGA